LRKSKEVPALLEVYRRDRAAAERAEPQVEVRDHQTPPPEAPAAAPSETVPSPRVLAEGDRLHFSLNTLSLALAIFVAGAVVAAAFWTGSRVGYSQGIRDTMSRVEVISGDKFRELHEQPPQAGVLDDLGQVNSDLRAEQARRRPGAEPSAAGFVDELNYIWIERCKSRDDAIDAQHYLRGAQIDAVTIQQGGEWLLVSSQGFDYRIPEQKQACLNLVERIAQVGRQYLQAGGRYRFKSFVKKKLPGENWSGS